MSVVTKVEAKSRMGKFFLAGVVVALLVGSVTMIYPFVLMLAGSMRSSMDSSDMGPVPRYFVDDGELAGKFLETKYNHDPGLMDKFRQTQTYHFRDFYIPENIDQQAIDDFQEFVETVDIPDHWWYLGGTQIQSLITSHVYHIFLQRVYERYEGDLGALNRDLGAPLRSWGQLTLVPPDWARSGFSYDHSPVYDEYFALARERPLADVSFINLSAVFLDNIVYRRYSREDVEDFNQALEIDIPSYRNFILTRRVPDETLPKLREIWLEFVFDDHLNVSFVRADVEAEKYQDFIREEFETIENLQLYWRDADQYDSFSDIELPSDDEWIPDYRRRHYRSFLETLEPERLRLVGPEYSWQDFLEDKYGSIEALNAARNSGYQNWTEVKMPIADVETQYVYENSGMLRRRFAGRNFRVVFDQVFVQGRAFVNTMVYVGLALFFSLTLQPMVAYALSRFNPPGTWKIIFIFVATMAFPPMVAMIPQFLIIQSLNLLNTFIALVLPVVINGYQIFLLKGFFDSIPQDLYDAALVDGASEMHMFRHITMALSYPILAVVALGTFRSAWMAFMYPLIVCPDERMHVLAVWLQQFQQEAPTPAVFASILVASIPSLLIFLFAQRTIMRGIAVPAEK